MQYINTGNQFQRDMGIKFNTALLSTSLTSNVREKENLVYEYIKNMGSAFQTMGFGVYGNFGTLQANYEIFKKDFVQYWRRALGIAKTDTQPLEDILDEAVINQEQCRNLHTTFVYFENGNALTIEGCLSAIYDVLEIA